jgi:hypothetical protein
MKRAASLLLAIGLASGCATEGTSGGGFYADAYWYDDPWYWGACCGSGDVDIVGPPPPRPEHPIATPSPPRPSQPIATPPVSRPTPMPRPAMRGGGGRR